MDIDSSLAVENNHVSQHSNHTNQNPVMNNGTGRGKSASFSHPLMAHFTDADSGDDAGEVFEDDDDGFGLNESLKHAQEVAMETDNGGKQFSYGAV